jgi:hypothetical protein
MNRLTYQPGCYLAYVLSDETRAELLQLCPPSFDRVICHHVTIAFNLNEAMFNRLIEAIRQKPSVVATGFLRGNDVECFLVEVNGEHTGELTGQRYHVTHSLRDPAKPVDSNKLIVASKGVPTKKLNVQLSGTLQMVKK